MKWHENIYFINKCLQELSVRNEKGEEIGAEEGFARWKEIALKVKNEGRRVYFIGNGASASMASHFAADLIKNAEIMTEVFFDLALLTSIANDISYDQVFSEPLKLKMDKADLLVAISSSGNSPNIVAGVQTARDIGSKVVSLSAMRRDNKIRSMSDLNFYIDAQTYGAAETCHAAIIHYWIDQMI